MHLNLNHLEILDAVAQTGSITLAADRLLVSQPAVSKQLRQLQRRLGVALLRRRGRGIELTEAGIAVAGLARRIVVAAQSVEQTLADLSSLRTGQLRIGASTTISVYLLPELLVRFRRKFPGVRLRVETEGSEILSRRLSDGEIDVGLMEVPTSQPGVRSRVFMQDALIPVASSDHPLARRPRIKARDFVREPFIARDGSDHASKLVDGAIAKLGLSVKPDLSLPSTEAVKRAVEAGLGVAVVSRLAASAELAAGRIVQVAVQGFTATRPLYWVTRSDLAESKAAHALHCLLEHAVRGSLPPLRRSRR